MLASVTSGTEVGFLLIGVVFVGIPAFVVGQRRGVDSPGIAFVPFVGAWIVILRSIGRSGWLAVLSVIPLVALGLYIWVAFTVPAEHGRTRWWTLPFLIPGANIVAFWVRAFTLNSAVTVVIPPLLGGQVGIVRGRAPGRDRASDGRQRDRHRRRLAAQEAGRLTRRPQPRSRPPSRPPAALLALVPIRAAPADTGAHRGGLADRAQS